MPPGVDPSSAEVATASDRTRAPLVSLVDEQLPEKPRTDDLAGHRRDVPAQHDEPDRFFAAVDGPIPRLGFGIVLGILKRPRHRPDEPGLLRGDPQDPKVASRAEGPLVVAGVEERVVGEGIGAGVLVIGCLRL